MNPSAPLLLIDVDGVISLFGFGQTEPPEGRWTVVDGTALETGPKGTDFLVVAWSTEVADRFALALAQQLAS